MHPILTEACTRLDRARSGLRAAVDAVPEPMRDRSPGPERWSVAGVLEHLALVEERFTAIVSTKIAEARAAALAGDDPAAVLFPASFEAMLADRTDRRVAPEPVHPRGLTWQAAWERLEAARATFRRTLVEGDGLALSQMVHEHPRFGALSPYQWAGFVAAHEARHTDQIREIAAQIPAPH